VPPLDRWQRAIELHQAGQLIQAKALYEEILTLEPGHCDAGNLLGVIVLQSGDLKAALRIFDRVVASDGGNVAALCNRGLALTELRQFTAALASYEQAIALDPGLAEAYFRRGNVLHELARPAEAVRSYQRAVDIDGGHAEAHFKCGHVLREQARWDAALRSYGAAIAALPDYEEAYLSRGSLLHELGDLQAALTDYDRAIALRADYAEAYYNRGNAFARLQRFEEALASYERAVSIQPGFAAAYSNRGNVLAKLHRLDEALACHDRAIELQGGFAAAHNNRGNVLEKLQRLDEALASHERAINLNTGADAFSNRGNLLTELGRFDEALASYNRAIALDADHAAAHLGRAMHRLLHGDLESGWADYEWRRGIEGHAHGHAGVRPVWRGDDSLAGKTVLLSGEQGLGDTLQFCRYAKLVAKLGAQVILEVQEPLVGLLSTLDGVTQVIPTGAPLPDFDYQCSLLSLPLACGTTLNTIPATGRYLAADSSRVASWQERLGTKTAPRIGLAWRGNPLHAKDHKRSIVLTEILDYLPDDLQYVCLQKDVSDAEQRALQSAGIAPSAAGLTDFSETAALCECLDLVITVDTSVAHLSGALGKPTWILLPAIPDWRWLLDRQDSPWYPAVKLYRQKRAGEWREVFERLRADLPRERGRPPMTG
jgi:tetratricopeptide (TPR) repeat protein